MAQEPLFPGERGVRPFLLTGRIDDVAQTRGEAALSPVIRFG